MKIALAQTKPITGDLEGNLDQIIEDIRKAKADNADIVVFPETAITGYCCGALFENEEFIKYNKEILEDIIAKEVPADMVAVVGFVDFKGRRKDGRLDISNSVAVIQGGEVLDTYDKILLANGNHHEDRKYFTPGREVKVTEVTVNGERIKLGTPICEDLWDVDHERDIAQEMKDLGADLLVCPNYSYFFYGKQEQRHELFRRHAEEKDLPLVYLNAAGVGDIVKNIMIYDGGSFAYDCKGNLVEELNRFGDDFAIIDLEPGKPAEKPKTMRKWDKFEEMHDALIFEQREIFDSTHIPNAQVHQSGGIDSAVTGYLVAKAMGPDRTVFISNPTEFNGEVTRGNAQKLSDALGVKLYWDSTQEPYEAIVASQSDSFGAEPDATAKANIQATLRTSQGIGATRRFKSAIVATGNQTEIVEGWATFHDIGSIGVHALIGDLTKVEVYELAEYINERNGREIIPTNLYDGTTAAAAELPDSDEDPFDYYVRSGICAELIRHQKGVDQIVQDYRNRTLTPDFFPPGPDGRDVYERVNLQEFAEQVWDAFSASKRSVFKAAQGAPSVIISPRSRGFSNRETIINHYAGWYDIGKMKQRYTG